MSQLHWLFSPCQFLIRLYHWQSERSSPLVCHTRRCSWLSHVRHHLHRTRTLCRDQHSADDLGYVPRWTCHRKVRRLEEASMQRITPPCERERERAKKDHVLVERNWNTATFICAEILLAMVFDVVRINAEKSGAWERILRTLRRLSARRSSWE